MTDAVVSADNLLVERVAQGDREAEAVLVARYYDRIVAAVRVRVGDRQAALDVAQEVVLGVLCGLRGGRLHAADHLAQYVAGTTRNLARRHRLCRPQSGQVELDDVRDAAPSPERIASSRETLHGVREAFNELAPRDRGILGMTLIAGMTSSEVARRTGMSREQARQRKARALRRLRVR